MEPTSLSAVQCIQSNTTLLSLLPDIRHLIYVRAGIIIDDHIDLDLIKLESYKKNPDLLKQLGISYNLLLTCRTTYAEVSAIIYSHNRFFICYDRCYASLDVLQNLRPCTIRHLTYLDVTLNLYGCSTWSLCCQERGGYLEGDILAQKFNWKKKIRPVIQKWQSIIDHFFLSITPHKLAMRFACDCDSEKPEVAIQAVKPFMSIQAPLAQCAIRLGSKPDAKLRDIAYRAVLSATRRKAPTSQFRFLDLPMELRLYILQLTDLVNPCLEFNWSPEKGFYGNRLKKCPYETRGSLQWPRKSGDSVTPNCCADSNSWCFCHQHHSIYSTFRPHLCWSPPTSLFLVCKSMRETAMEIFFKKNKLVVDSTIGAFKYPVQHDHAPLRSSTLLKDVLPRPGLQYLSFLDIIFLHRKEDYILDKIAYKEWLVLIEFMRENLCLSRLTLRVCIGDAAYAPYEEWPLILTTKQMRMLQLMYARILWPLGKLKDLKDFLFNVDWPNEESAAKTCRFFTKRVMGEHYEIPLQESTPNFYGNQQWYHHFRPLA